MVRRIAARCLAAWVPDEAPLRWTVVNALCFVWSLGVLISIFTIENKSDRKWAQALYLTYNFGTTAIWCFESVVTAWYNYPLLGWKNGLELGVAVYFLFDSMKLLLKWRLHKGDLEAESVETLINVLAFLYATQETYRFYRREASRRNQGFESVEDGKVPLA